MTSNTSLSLSYRRAEEKKLRKQEIVGYVSSAKAAKTITVTYYHDKWIPKYNVHISTRRKIMAHDEEGVCSEGDMVRIVPCRLVLFPINAL